jgi:hypothetical protein
MGIAMTIVLGLTLMTFFAAGFDYLGKRAKKPSLESAEALKDLEARVKRLEASLGERDERVARLESELQFTTRLIEDRTKEK